MSRRYDSKTTMFSPEGRLYQVEYAMEAVGHAGTCLGILAKDGIVLCAEKKTTHKLLDNLPGSAEKLYRIDDHCAVGIAGITADANALITMIRNNVHHYKLVYQEHMPVEQVVRRMADIKQYFTQTGGVRPYGVSILYCGWDKHLGFQLYQGDPSGNYGGWKATCIGNNNQSAISMLEQDYDADIDTKGAINLAMKILSKTLDAQTLSSEKIEVAVVQRENGKVQYKVLPAKDVDFYCKIAADEKKKKMEEEEKKKKAASAKK